MKQHAMVAALLCAVVCAVVVPSAHALQQDTFTEELLLRPFSDGNVMAFFSFTTLSPQTESRRHFHLMPRFVGDMMDARNIYELDITIARGVWRTKAWGFAPRPTATGATVSAFFTPDVAGSVDQAWTKLVNSLSGQFCASLNFLQKASSVSPKWSFQPRGLTPISHNGSLFRFGNLPGENVCTENLTPWKKLLPCKSNRGLATLLNAQFIHRAKHHGLGLSIRRVCPDSAEECSHPLIELNQYVVLVFDPSTLPDDRRNYVTGSPDWSLRKLFGIGINSYCPMASASRLFMDLNDAPEARLHSDHKAEEVVGAREISAFNLQKLCSEGIVNVQVWHEKDRVIRALKPARVFASRYLVGHGQQKGGLVTKIYNSDPHSPIKVVLLDVLPWFLRLFLHTLTINVVGSDHPLKPFHLNFEPGVDREKPYLMELVLEVPAKSQVKVFIEFEHSLLKWQEYPPDANKGFYVSPALISTKVPSCSHNLTGVARSFSSIYDWLKAARVSECGSEDLVQIYTEALLANLPTPDFSMPYNVICLVCSVLAFAFAPIYNMTTKKPAIQQPDTSSATDTPRIKKVQQIIAGLFQRKKNLEIDAAKKNE